MPGAKDADTEAVDAATVASTEPAYVGAVADASADSVAGAAVAAIDAVFVPGEYSDVADAVAAETVIDDVAVNVCEVDANA